MNKSFGTEIVLSDSHGEDWVSAISLLGQVKLDRHNIQWPLCKNIEISLLANYRIGHNSVHNVHNNKVTNTASMIQMSNDQWLSKGIALVLYVYFTARWPKQCRNCALFPTLSSLSAAGRKECNQFSSTVAYQAIPDTSQQLQVQVNTKYSNSLRRIVPFITFARCAFRLLPTNQKYAYT